MFTVRVRDVMSAPAITVAHAASLKDVANLMLRHGIGALPVVDAPVACSASSARPTSSPGRRTAAMAEGTPQAWS